MTQRPLRKLWNAESSVPVRKIVFVFAAIAAMLTVFQLCGIAMHFLEYLPAFRYDPVSGETSYRESNAWFVMGLLGGLAFVLVGTWVAPKGYRLTALGILGGLLALVFCAGIPAMIPPSHGIEFLFLGMAAGGMLAAIAVVLNEARTRRMIVHRSTRPNGDPIP